MLFCYAFLTGYITQARKAAELARAIEEGGQKQKEASDRLNPYYDQDIATLDGNWELHASSMIKLS